MTVNNIQTPRFQLRNSTLITLGAIAAITVGFIFGSPAVGGMIAAAIAPFVGGSFIYKAKKTRILKNDK